MLRIYSILNRIRIWISTRPVKNASAVKFLLILLILSTEPKFQQFSSFSANLILKSDRSMRDHEPDNTYLDVFVA